MCHEDHLLYGDVCVCVCCTVLCVCVLYGDVCVCYKVMCVCREEREWREWVDSTLIHMLPPNIYRTLSEAIISFDYISSVGNFNLLERMTAKYLGAISMFLISKRLKKRYRLKEDVRESLYEACEEWCSALGGRRFMGGDEPNLADLVSLFSTYYFILTDYSCTL